VRQSLRMVLNELDKCAIARIKIARSAGIGFIIVIEIQCRDKITSQLLTVPSSEIADDDLAQRVITPLASSRVPASLSLSLSPRNGGRGGAGERVRGTPAGRSLDVWSPGIFSVHDYAVFLIASLTGHSVLVTNAFLMTRRRALIERRKLRSSVRPDLWEEESRRERGREKARLQDRCDTSDQS
jgi:hypothetical protein